MQGVKSVMKVEEARRVCRDIVLVPQEPDLYRRAHNALLSEIETVIPIDAIKSIDELTCRLDEAGRRDPAVLAGRIKAAIARNIGKYITVTVGFAANRQLAKMACKAGKWHDGIYGDGLMIWSPPDMPGPLFAVDLPDVPGVGERMAMRLYRAGIQTTEQLYRTEPKHMRKLWGNVTGERLWYALHGYDIQAEPSERGMFGHGRVLPPELRNIAGAEKIARLLLTKAARRLRREGYYAGGLWLWLSLYGGGWSRKKKLPIVHDDQAVLSALADLWGEVRREHARGATIFQVGVTLFDLSAADHRQLDMLLNDDRHRQKWERVSSAVDDLNARYARTIIHQGEWNPPAGGHVGGKISYTRIPTVEDFW